MTPKTSQLPVKIRFWNPDTKTMIYPEYGDPTFIYCIQNPDFIPMLCIGIKTKDGKHVLYEGDIFNYTLKGYKSQFGAKTAIVTWDEKRAKYVFGCYKDEWVSIGSDWNDNQKRTFTSVHTIELVGNIYEHSIENFV